MANRFTSMMGAQDMTVGKPMSNLLKFSIPLLIGNIAQQCYSTVDSVVVGYYVGDHALAAVGASMPIINLLLILFMAISTGAGVMVSQYFGAKEKDLLSKTIGTSIVLIVISSIAVTVVGVFATRGMLQLINTPADIFDMASEYLIIIFVGIIGGGFYNIISGILRGLGDSVFPLIFLLISTVLNIVLDILFVAQFDMGVAGVAWATIIAQGISAVFCIMRLMSMSDVIQIDKSNIKMDMDLTKRLLGIGLPSGLTQGIFSLAKIAVQALSNSMGTAVVATSTAVMRIDGFAMMPNFTFGMATSTFVGQNIGARRMDRVEQGTKDSIIMTLVISCTLTLSLLIFSPYMIRWFTQTETVINLGVRAIRILAVGYIAVGISQVYTGIMRGAGDTMPPMWISIFTTVALRIPVAYAWAYFTRSPQWPNGSPDALYFSLVVSWTMGAVITYLWYCRGTWRNKSIMGAPFTPAAK